MGHATMQQGMECIDNSVVEDVCAYALWPLYVKVSTGIFMYKLRT